MPNLSNHCIYLHSTNFDDLHINVQFKVIIMGNVFLLVIQNVLFNHHIFRDFQIFIIDLQMNFILAMDTVCLILMLLNI